MEKVTSETILKNYPAVWWEIWRQGRTETLNDPNAQREMAQRHLQATLTKPGATTPAQPLPASTTSRPSAVTVDSVQAAVNRQLGLSTETFVKYNREAQSQADPAQAEINRRLGISEETFLKYANR